MPFPKTTNHAQRKARKRNRGRPTKPIKGKKLSNVDVSRYKEIDRRNPPKTFKMTKQGPTGNTRWWVSRIWKCIGRCSRPVPHHTLVGKARCSGNVKASLDEPLAEVLLNSHGRESHPKSQDPASTSAAALGHAQIRQRPTQLQAAQWFGQRQRLRKEHVLHDLDGEFEFERHVPFPGYRCKGFPRSRGWSRFQIPSRTLRHTRPSKDRSHKKKICQCRLLCSINIQSWIKIPPRIRFLYVIRVIDE